ncbi:MAG: GAF domain-containing protein [Hyphomicrobiales bacterium]
MTAPVRLEDIPSAFEGVIPALISTIGDDGWPNITYLSVVHRVDSDHIALSRQFFNKTDRNTQQNRFARVSLVEPETGRRFELDVEYVRTDTSGPLFERMNTRLDAVAAHEGMENTFRLIGTDICRVLSCEMIPCDYPESAVSRPQDFGRIEELSSRIAAADDMDELFRITLEGCAELMGYPHAFIMLLDEAGERLYTVASSGYSSSGAGSEVMLGEGLIGLAAERRQAVRVTQMTRELTYSHASHQDDSQPASRERTIPLPALPSVQSQLVTPMLAAHRLVGVLCLQSQAPGAFRWEDECISAVIANQVAMAMAVFRATHPMPTVKGVVAGEAAPALVRYYPEDGSVFVDNEYLIKGVAGGILWRLLKSYSEEHRVDFSNKEIRLDPSLDLPDIKDNLEARLILLRRRLEERCTFLSIEKTSRGRFRLVVSRPLVLSQAEGSH